MTESPYKHEGQIWLLPHELRDTLCTTTQHKPSTSQQTDNSIQRHTNSHNIHPTHKCWNSMTHHIHTLIWKQRYLCVPANTPNPHTISLTHKGIVNAYYCIHLRHINPSIHPPTHTHTHLQTIYPHTHTMLYRQPPTVSCPCSSAKATSCRECMNICWIRHARALLTHTALGAATGPRSGCTHTHTLSNYTGKPCDLSTFTLSRMHANPN